LSGITDQDPLSNVTAPMGFYGPKAKKKAATANRGGFWQKQKAD
jgi:hypothetical protein